MQVERGPVFMNDESTPTVVAVDAVTANTGINAREAEADGDGDGDGGRGCPLTVMAAALWDRDGCISAICRRIDWVQLPVRMGAD